MDELNLEEQDNIIVLGDDEGNEASFEFLDLIDYQGGEYVVLLPVEKEDEEEDDEVIILRLEPTDDPEDEVFSTVDDSDTWMAIFEIFKEKFADVFDFRD